ncbi:UbiX family flavin prenyltransferase [Petroclostridium sp. X23]|uniref:UbiX family flavin prenyltransferase n=1 Tax=Petroclostridium sp. X23 TaxID=3045146 RepID=UPI0024AD7714|nr:UbiX family flavin prenyltransferase [Petroclostridium sp. X23]WHH59282.1 UbiX family flavin prenyltransferase [Petroclostridium sp. X23]
MRLVVAITGATGAIYAMRLLEELKAKKVEVHLILSEWAEETLRIEMNMKKESLIELVDYYYLESDMTAPVASGSFQHQGMIIIPCSMKTLSGIAHGYAENLIIRAADVCLKECRRLILVPRETPLNAIHLDNMLKLAKLGVEIVPPMPAFYNHPVTIEEIVNQLIARILDQLGLEHNLVKRWGDTMKS